MSIRSLIVDDEPLARELLRELLSREPDVEVVAECGSGEEALRLSRRLHPDLLLLDVQMPGMSGFELVAGLGRAQPMPYVIFATAHDRYALRAFEVQAVDYLLKPIHEERLRASVERARQALRHRALSELADRMSELAVAYADLRRSDDASDEPAPEHRSGFVLREGRAIRRVAVEEIVWIEAANQYVRLHTRSGSSLSSTSLSQLERELDPRRFCRIHRSSIVHVEAVREVLTESHGACAVILDDGTRLRLSRRRRSVLARLLARR